LNDGSIANLDKKVKSTGVKYDVRFVHEGKVKSARKALHYHKTTVVLKSVDFSKIPTK